MNSSSAILTVICGPMKSGKSKELFSIIDRLNYQKIKYIIFKPKIDSRNENTISSRYYSQSNEAIIIDEQNPQEILNYIPENSLEPLTTLIDEAHFFSSELISVVKSLLSKEVNVIISGLDLDANMKTFGPMGDLLALSNKIKKLNSVCERCYNVANFSALKDSQQSFEKDNILVGNEQYIVLCRNCYLRHTQKC
ncbi:thymidine kinase [Candidatus Mycoplasma haematominutum]|uniref:Thymidine kinase n=1 Tax=Candidatus Mycoplasma haematominutum 'Birmingham 1' TaxID=1116213 RepID=G8C2K3_9MOLU|nr:thymidine kinase [Candidatus Mycoplasma haematominutum]CCE66551.1 thymidine kinase [Candidatus Mycoplasma haematominutum 'Birmingham 1']